MTDAWRVNVIQAGQQNVQVLLVEDSLPVRQRIRSLIEESGQASVIGEAGSVTKALALLRHHKPNALVLDLHLAEGAGYPVLEEAKQTQPDCEVIVLTNFAVPEYRDRCHMLGADHFFEKSRDFERVPEVLATIGRKGRRNGRILIADDEAMVGEVLVQFLRSSGYDCEWVADAARAVEALNRTRYDLLIADINMPGNRNLELMQQLPKLAPGLPVILLTGDPNVESAASAVRLNAKAYLAKPPELAELKSLVRESIANYRVHQAVRRKWDEFDTLSLDLNRHLATPRNTSTDPGEWKDMETMFTALSAVIRNGRLIVTPDAIQLTQHIELVNALRETISVLEKTRRSFKSKQLGHLRLRLEALIGGIDLQHAPLETQRDRVIL